VRQLKPAFVDLELAIVNWSAPNRSALAKSVFAASLALWTTPPCWRYFQIQELELKTKAIKDPALRLPPTLLRSGRFRRCRASGFYQASSMMWQPDLVRSSCYQR
jgi:hypothetical protein